jgi:hypothetical protein
VLAQPVSANDAIAVTAASAKKRLRMVVLVAIQLGLSGIGK